MAHSPDHEDTQLVDSPPPDTVPFDDETQPVDDCYDLYGETQVVEEDDEVVRGVEEWIETQAVDDLEETQVLVDDDDDDDVFEKRVANLADGGVGETQVLVGDGVQEPVLANIVDEETQVLLCDGTQEAIFERKEGNLAGPDGGCGDGVQDKETQILVEDGVGEAIFEEKGGDLAASDASVDVGIGGGGDNTPYDLQLAGGSCKSNSGHTTLIWSSGLAAAHCNTPEAIDVEPKSLLSNGEKCGSQDNGGDGEKGKELDTQYMQDHDKKSNMDNSRVRKLLCEHTTALDDDTMINPNKVRGEVDSPCSLVPDYVVAGLSYIESQEPGDLSQANALDIVDKLISVNDLGLSQETNTGKTDMVKSPPISSAKGAQSLAKMVDRSPVGKVGTFLWIDSQEDEGGGEFFTKRKEAFFDCEVAERKSRTQPTKSKEVSFGLTKEAVDKTGKKFSNIQNRQKVSSLACSDSRVMLRSSFRNGKVHVSKTKAKKNLFKYLNEQSNSVNKQQLEVTDIERDGEGTYEVGPDTQMAAEAMEALVHGSPINYEKNDVHAVAENSAKIGSEGAAMKKKSSKKTSLRNSTSFAPNTEGVSTRSKRRRIVPTKSSFRSPMFSRSKSQNGKSLDCTAVKTKEEKENKKLERYLNKRNIVDKIEFPVSLKGGKAISLVNGAINKEVDSFDNSLKMNVQLSVSKDHTSCEFNVSSTPVAHRTRHSKAVKLSEPNEALANSGRDTSGSTGVRTRRAIAREDKLAPVASGKLKMKRKGSDIESDQDALVERIEMQHEEKPKAMSFVDDTFSHPKRRRTSHINPDNQYINSDMKISSVSVDNIQLRTQNGQTKATIRSVSEILDTAKRKKRSVSTRLASEIDGMPSNSKTLRFKSIVTRSSMKSLSNPNLENRPNECSPMPVLDKAGSTDSANPWSTPLKQGGDLISLKENERDKAKTEASPKDLQQYGGLTCTTPLKDLDVVSPVCVAEDRPRAFDNRHRSRSSIARELIRLENCEASPTGIFNTRRRRDIASVRILFSHHLDADVIRQQKKIIGRLGIALASSISDATHFVTDKFVRTRNMLEAMSMGKPVVTHMWLESCGQTSCFIDEKNYILRDAKKEKEIGFSMPVSLARACQSPLLQDKRVYITPNTKPDRELLSSLVKAGHGQPVERIGRSALKDDKLPEDLLVLSCEEDYELCIPLLEKGAEVFSSELLLNGIVIQKLEYERHGLFSDHVKRTRSTLWLRHKDGDQFLPVTKCT
ncbi:uncharacterized protein M6B38_275330 [Iris pallida]|uniref:BRCT domain-containing protein n=1 Tax=Iris pallida TaxID=29817 RepID=A0AAX6I5X7_IRIPA|nr:uncharacterized protein M6B38_275330 [Iris pallida]